MRQVSSGVFLPAADRQGIYSKILSEECNNGNFLGDWMFVCRHLSTQVNFYQCLS